MIRSALLAMGIAAAAATTAAAQTLLCHKAHLVRARQPRQ
jgi:F0F1-type ATP synthase membrane subunit c/vacuolar-type H+-ATPase subunit K